MTTYSDPGAIGDVVGTTGRIEATWGNAIRDRVVNRYASTAARDAADATPSEGMFCYVTADDCYYGYTGATWLAYDLVSKSYTPTLVQAFAITKTVTTATYQRTGSTCTFIVRLAVTGAEASGNNNVTVTLPVTASVNSDIPIGGGWIFDASVGGGTAYPVFTVMATTSAVRFLDSTQATVGVFLGQTGTAFTAALASSDVIAIGGTYPIA